MYNSKWIKNPNVRPETVKFRENIGRKLFHMKYSNISFALSPKPKETKAKIKKLELIKFKSFCTAKEIVNRREEN